MKILRAVNVNMVLAFAVFCGAAVLPASGQGLPVQWTAWSSATAGSPGSAIGALSPGGLGVTYSGDNFGLYSDPNLWLPTSTFVGPSIANAAPAGSTGIKLKGGTTHLNTITFAGPVSNPVLSIVSLGQTALQAAFNFATAPFTIIACGPSADFAGVCITQTANNVLGNEGSGTIQFAGTFTSISWTNPIFEDFYVFTVGVPTPDYFQVSYASNLAVGDSVVDITNVGAGGAGLNSGTSASTTGALCANIYAFTPDEQMVSCCSCPVTPDGLVSLSAKNDLASNTLTPAIPSALVIKLLATVPIGGSCANSAAAVTSATLATGVKAFGTTIHAAPGVPAAYSVTERPFSRATLSAGELARLGNLCNFIIANGSGFGICNSCRLGGLGAVRQ